MFEARLVQGCPLKKCWRLWRISSWMRPPLSAATKESSFRPWTTRMFPWWLSTWELTALRISSATGPSGWAWTSRRCPRFSDMEQTKPSGAEGPLRDKKSSNPVSYFSKTTRLFYKSSFCWSVPVWLWNPKTCFRIVKEFFWILPKRKEFLWSGTEGPRGKIQSFE